MIEVFLAIRPLSPIINTFLLPVFKWIYSSSAPASPPSAAASNSLSLLQLLHNSSLPDNLSTKSKMQLTTFLSTLLAATAIAVPTTGGGGGGDGGKPWVACTPGSLYSNPQCCATDVLGVADLDCQNRKFYIVINNTLGQWTNSDTATKFPTSAKDFQSTCAAVGQRPRCCVLPVVSIRPNASQRFSSLTMCYSSGKPCSARPPLAVPKWAEHSATGSLDAHSMMFAAGGLDRLSRMHPMR